MDAAETMAAVDDALRPIYRMAESPGSMNTSALATVAAAIRQALAMVVYGPPAPALTQEDDSATAGPVDPPVTESPGSVDGPGAGEGGASGDAVQPEGSAPVSGESIFT
jgi:hypothetical protein